MYLGYGLLLLLENLILSHIKPFEIYRCHADSLKSFLLEISIHNIEKPILAGCRFKCNIDIQNSDHRVFLCPEQFDIFIQNVFFCFRYNSNAFPIWQILRYSSDIHCVRYFSGKISISNLLYSSSDCDDCSLHSFTLSNVYCGSIYYLLFPHR